MTGYVVMVDFRLRPGTKSAFRRLVDENARASCRDEPGCGVSSDGADDGADRVFLYDIYDDPRPSTTHNRTPHFAAFDSASAPHVVEKPVTTHDLVLEVRTPNDEDSGKTAWLYWLGRWRRRLKRATSWSNSRRRSFTY